MIPPPITAPAPKGAELRAAAGSGLRYALIGAGIISVVVTVTFGVIVQRSLPRWDGELEAPGLQKRVEVLRDDHGVPHIYAESSADAYFALGFAHAQDRLFQLELNRRLGNGTLSELFGARTLLSDRFFRILGLRPLARDNLRELDAPTRDVLAAYARGINASIEAGASAPELQALGVQPAAFAPEDCLVWLKLVAWQLGGNFFRELANVRLRQELSDEQLAQLLPPYPGEQALPFPVRTELSAALDRVTKALLESSPAGASAAQGSNAWVLSGARTASGKPLLANDPHLGLSAPSIWYFAHLHAPDLNVIGATMPGLPAVLAGRNDRVAWGFTNTGSDTQDLFIEKLAGADTRYETPDGVADFAVREEEIVVKGGAIERLRVRVSRHGPVISDLSEETRRAAPSGHVLALSWAALRADDLTMQFPIKAAQAQSAGELVQATRDFHSPQQNIVYADVAGVTGSITAGRVPVRAPGDVASGRIPVEGHTGKHDWQGFVPFEELPASGVDARGLLVSANQKVTPDGYPHFITSEWEPPYRAQRIRTLLEQKDKHGVLDFERMQLDVESPIAVELLPSLLDATKAMEEGRALHERLRRWDRRMTREAPEPLLFESWLEELASALYPAALEELLGDYNPRFLAAIARREPSFAAWCPPAQAGAEGGVWAGCDAAARAAFVRAIRKLEQRHGRDVSAWRWGEHQVAAFHHLTFSGLPVLGRLLDVERPRDGGRETVNLSASVYDELRELYLSHTGPSFRAIYDLSDLERSQFVLSPGQSGHPLSSFYRDLSRLWAAGQYAPMITVRSEVLRNTAGRLSLRPVPQAHLLSRYKYPNDNERSNP